MDANNDSSAQSGNKDMGIFQPPIIRSTAALNRALFSKTCNLAAASVKDVRKIAKYRSALSKNHEILSLDRVSPIVNDPDPSQSASGRKCLLLKPGISPSGMLDRSALEALTYRLRSTGKLGRGSQGRCEARRAGGDTI